MSLGYKEEDAVGLRTLTDSITPDNARFIEAPKQVTPGERLIPHHGESLAQDESISTSLRRSVRTFAPLLIADFISLTLAATLADLVVNCFYPSAAGIIMRVAPIALLPLMVAYWLSDLYSEIW